MLAADFEKTFFKGPTIRVRLAEPASASSVTAILGPSGGGKTTILRCLAGLERPDRGTISLGGEIWFHSARHVHVPPERRGVGLLFQDYALFPHMTVERNILFALGDAGAAARTHVRQLLDEFQLTGLERRYPSQLSGGQQQRVALARAVSRAPRLLLLDEPLAALDAPTRDEIRRPLKLLLSRLGIPVLLVTHDRLDALSLADRVAIVEDGAIVQSGPIAEVFASPVSARVARQVGVETIAPGRVVALESGVCVLSVGRAVIRAAGAATVGDAVDVCIRAEDVTLFQAEPSGASAQNRWVGRIVGLTDTGGVWRVALDCGFILTAIVTRTAGGALGLREGGEVWAVVKATAVTMLSAAGRPAAPVRP